MGSIHDRQEGVLLATAAGDALGAPFEFGPSFGPEIEISMSGGGVWGPGEFTDDTAMMIAIAEAAAAGLDLRTEAAQDQIVARWRQWSRTTKDIGIQTGSVLRAATVDGTITAARCRMESERLHKETGHTAGNGSLMRTAPVALAYLDDEQAMVEAARAISELTHFDPLAGDACVLWCVAIRHAVLTGELDVRVGLRHLNTESRGEWARWIDEAEAHQPAHFCRNGFVVQALQGAWSAIHHTPEPADDPLAGVFRADRLRLGLEAAIRGGKDTDTVAAIAGGLLGAAYGASAVPLEWRQKLNGWPDATARTLVQLASAIVRKGEPDVDDLRYGHASPDRWVRHPYDDNVVLGTVGVLRELPPDITAVVSMCRLRDSDIRTDMPHIEVRLIDKEARDHNRHLDFVLLETVKTIERLRAEGHTVLVHCVGAQSRTPTVGALYAMRRAGLSADDALNAMWQALGECYRNEAFHSSLQRFEGGRR